MKWTVSPDANIFTFRILPAVRACFHPKSVEGMAFVGRCGIEQFVDISHALSMKDHDDFFGHCIGPAWNSDG